VLIAVPAIRPAWTIGRSIWLARRAGFLALLSAPLICGWLFHLSSRAFLEGDGPDLLGYLPMGLSLFLTFVFCNFTESDRRGRFDGFPSRLFTLPVSTRTLIATPIVFNVLAIGVIYAAWAKLALPALGRELPLSWPILYLATGMICYQAIVWALARFRIARLIILGIGGSVLALGWIALRRGVERELLVGVVPNGLDVHSITCAGLVVMSIGALVLANIAVENQRRGGISKWKGWPGTDVEQSSQSGKLHAQGTLLERIADALPRRQKRFDSPARAQFWFEWRRHGSVLPLATGTVLFVIIAPAPFCAPISAERVGLLLCWIIALPLLLAFVLGKGFGKADLWSKEPGLPLFQATRPLSNTHWIGAKMKAAALATVSSWLIVLVMTPLWLWLWCDYQSLLQEWRAAANRDPKVFSASLAAIPILILFTWRFLIGSLYLGLSGKTWMLNVTACGVFLSIFAPVIGAIPFVQRNFHHLLFPPRWLPWLLAGLFATKFTAAAALAGYARWKGLVTNRAIGNYAAVWFGIVALLVILVWRMVPFELISPDSGWNKASFMLLPLFLMPLLRVSCAPIALAQNRRR